MCEGGEGAATSDAAEVLHNRFMWRQGRQHLDLVLCHLTMHAQTAGENKLGNATERYTNTHIHLGEIFLNHPACAWPFLCELPPGGGSMNHLHALLRLAQHLFQRKLLAQLRTVPIAGGGGGSRIDQCN